MQESEEFCRKIDMKLRRSMISTLAVIFAAACCAAAFIYKFAPVDDFLVDNFRDGSVSTGRGADFLMAMAQADDNGAFTVTGYELSDGVLTAVIYGENRSADDLTLTPGDFSVYATDISNDGKPYLCLTNMVENVVIPAGSSAEFIISANVPDYFTYEGCKASVIISEEISGEKYGLMLN